MKYVSIDLETTGLNPENCQILQFAAVADDLKTPLEKLPTFERYITNPYDEYRGESYALALNHKIIGLLAKANQMKLTSAEIYQHDGKSCVFCNIDELMTSFQNWLTTNGFEEDKKGKIKVTVAGKNVAGFDMPFLKAHIDDFGSIKFNHRVIDPGSMYVTAKDEAVPDTAECMKRAGLSGEVAHTALEDAMMVVKLVRAKLCGS